MGAAAEKDSAVRGWPDEEGWRSPGRMSPAFGALPPPASRAGERRAAAARTCSRNPEQLWATVREARTPGGREPRGGDPSWHQPAPSEKASALAASAE